MQKKICLFEMSQSARSVTICPLEVWRFLWTTPKEINEMFQGSEQENMREKQTILITPRRKVLQKQRSRLWNSALNLFPCFEDMFLWFNGNFLFLKQCFTEMKEVNFWIDDICHWNKGNWFKALLLRRFLCFNNTFFWVCASIKSFCDVTISRAYSSSQFVMHFPTPSF